MPTLETTLEAVAALYGRPLLDLVYEAATVHRANHDSHDVQRCTLLSVKTGGCPEDCSYCPQSAHYKSDVQETPMLSLEQVASAARDAKSHGATRFCMGAAWREVQDGPEFDHVLSMVREVAALDIEVCCTLGMLTKSQATRLKAAGLTAYNHNLDTSENNYNNIITTRDYEDRLATLAAVRAAGVQVCSGGIVGLGESDRDRIEFLHTLANLNPPPESVPINGLVRAPGTPLADMPPVDPFLFVRMVAVARILMPGSRIRLAAGRTDLSEEAQALAYLAGANSIFYGDRLLTTPNPGVDADIILLRKLGLGDAKAAAQGRCSTHPSSCESQQNRDLKGIAAG